MKRGGVDSSGKHDFRRNGFGEQRSVSKAIRFEFLQGVAYGRSLAEHLYFRTTALDPVSGRKLSSARVKRFRDGWEEGLVAAAISR